MANVLIAGCGYVGRQLAANLVDLGHQVWVLRRSVQPAMPQIQNVVADLLDAGALAASVPANIATVFYTAAPSERSPAGYRGAYVDGLRNLLDVVSKQSSAPTRCLFTSSTGVYAQEDGQWVDETSSTAPQHFSGKILVEAEALLHSYPLESVVVRLGGIYGPSRTRLLESVRSGQARLYAKDVYTNRIHRDDAAGLLAHLAFLNNPQDCYLGVDELPELHNTVVAWLAQGLGVPPPTVGTQSLTDGRRHRSNKRCSNQRLKATGYQWKYPSFREGYLSLF